jgi:hypothetical protein
MAYSTAHFREMIFMTIKEKASNSDWVIGLKCWIVASILTLCSLFFSEIMELVLIFGVL